LDGGIAFVGCVKIGLPPSDAAPPVKVDGPSAEFAGDVVRFGTLVEDAALIELLPAFPLDVAGFDSAVGAMTPMGGIGAAVRNRSDIEPLSGIVLVRKPRRFGRSGSEAFAFADVSPFSPAAAELPPAAGSRCDAWASGP
jgi:hypothetical protein